MPHLTSIIIFLRNSKCFQILKLTSYFRSPIVEKWKGGTIPSALHAYFVWCAIFNKSITQLFVWCSIYNKSIITNLLNSCSKTVKSRFAINTTMTSSVTMETHTVEYNTMVILPIRRHLTDSRHFFFWRDARIARL